MPRVDRLAEYVASMKAIAHYPPSPVGVEEPSSGVPPVSVDDGQEEPLSSVPSVGLDDG